MNNFTPLRMAVLTGLIGLQDHIGSLDADDCPYDAETKDSLRKLLAPRIVEKIIEKEVMVGGTAGRGRPTKDVKLDTEDQAAVLAGIRQTLADLEELGKKEGLQTSERIQVAKTQTALHAELLKMMERHTTVTKMEAFKEEVIKILDDLVSEADRETFLKRIEPLR